MKNRRKYLIIILISILISDIYAQKEQQTDANIVGHVINGKTGEHIPFVSIGLKGTNIGTMSDATGHYTMHNLPTGSYIVASRMMGFKDEEQEVNLVKGKTIELNFTLEEEATILNQVVISASKNESNRKGSVSIVNVLTPKTFETANAICLSDGLNFQPGLRVENNCQNCGFSQLRINGLEGPYTQILIDSRAINSALAGVYGLEHIPVNMIDRVEVMRGGGSALFGSNAIAGTVNIITKEPDKNSFSIANTFHLIGGKTPDNSVNLNASVISNNNKAGVTLFGAARNRGVYDANSDGYSEIGLINLKSLGFRGYIKIGNFSKMTLEYHTIDEYRRGGDSISKPPHEVNIAEQTDHQIHSGGLRYDLFFKEKYSLQLYASLQYIGRKSYYGAGKDPNAYGNTKDLSVVGGSQFTWRISRFLFSPATFIAGIEYARNRLHDEMSGYNRNVEQSVDIYSLFAQNEWTHKKFTFLLGGRLDYHSLMKKFVPNPRISGRYAPTDWLNIRASYASGYRGPQTFDEDLHIMAVGGGVSLISLAENLQPEKSHSSIFSMEFSHSHGRNGFLALIEGFYTTLDNVFVLHSQGVDNEGNLLLERRNGSGATVAGINLEVQSIFWNGKVQLNAGFTLQSSLYKQAEQWSEDLLPQKKMFRSPADYGYATVLCSPVKNLDLSLTASYTGRMLVQHFAGYIDRDEELMTHAFFDLGLKIAYTFSLKENIKLQLNTGIKNIFNSYQRDFDQGANRDAGYIYGPSLPRTCFVGVKLGI